MSLLDIVDLAAASLPVPSDGSAPPTGAALAFALAAVRATPEAHRRLVTPDGRSCRVILPLDPIGGREFAAIESAVADAVSPPPAGVSRARPIGLVHDVMAAQSGILGGQIASFSVALVVVAGVLGAVVRSARWAVALLVVHAAPLAVAVTVLRWLDLPLDIATAMVASVALGMAVDDSAHILCAHGGDGASGPDGDEDPLTRVSPALITTSIVLVAGFSTLVVASFPPIARFGAFTALALALSSVAHFTVLPALLPTLTPRSPST